MVLSDVLKVLREAELWLLAESGVWSREGLLLLGLPTGWYPPSSMNRVSCFGEFPRSFEPNGDDDV